MFIAILSINLRNKILIIQCTWKKVVAISLHIIVIFKNAIERDYYFALNRYIYQSSSKTTKT